MGREFLWDLGKETDSAFAQTGFVGRDWRVGTLAAGGGDSLQRQLVFHRECASGSAIPRLAG